LRKCLNFQDEKSEGHLVASLVEVSPGVRSTMEDEGRVDSVWRSIMKAVCPHESTSSAIET